jgi:hypothetical protein
MSDGGRAPGPRTSGLAGEAAGWALLAGGAALMVLPGPGIPLVLAGLVIVGRRRQWARRAHGWVREQADRGLERVRSIRERGRTG